MISAEQGSDNPSSSGWEGLGRVHRRPNKFSNLLVSSRPLLEWVSFLLQRLCLFFKSRITIFEEITETRWNAKNNPFFPNER